MIRRSISSIDRQIPTDLLGFICHFICDPSETWHPSARIYRCPSSSSYFMKSKHTCDYVLVHDFCPLSGAQAVPLCHRGHSDGVRVIHASQYRLSNCWWHFRECNSVNQHTVSPGESQACCATSQFNSLYRIILESQTMPLSQWFPEPTKLLENKQNIIADAIQGSSSNFCIEHIHLN